MKCVSDAFHPWSLDSVQTGLFTLQPYKRSHALNSTMLLLEWVWV